MLDLMVEYYMVTYELFEFQKPFEKGSDDDIVIRVKMNQFRRCRIGSNILGSLILIWHAKSSYILAKFITNDGTVDYYPGQVQFYFTHTIDLPNGLTEHFLAFVRWYQPVASSNIQYYFSANDNKQTCKGRSRNDVI